MYSVEQTLVEIVQRDSKRTKLTIPAEGPARLKLRQDDDQSANLFLEFAAKIVLAVRPNRSTMRMSLMMYNGEARVMNKSVTAHEDDIKKLVEMDAFGHAKLTDVENNDTARVESSADSDVEVPISRIKCNCKCHDLKPWYKVIPILWLQYIFIAFGASKMIQITVGLVGATEVWHAIVIVVVYLAIALCIVPKLK